MRNALLKDTFREIRRTLSRFLSIFAIVALGVAFFAGVKASSRDMEITGDKYFDDYNLMDVRLVSTLGFDDKDLSAIRKIQGLEGIWPTYTMDAIAELSDRDMVIRVMGLPVDKVNHPDESYINRTKLIAGRYPERPDEILTEKGKMLNPEMSIGSKIKLSSGTDKDINESLERNEYTIVGLVETPYFISYDRGSSSIGNGKVNSFIMIPEENFKLPVYTDVFATVKGARQAFTFDEEYKDIVKPVIDSLKDTAKVREQERYDEIISEANDKLNESKQELADAEEKSNTELKKAEDKLISGRKQLAEGERQLQAKEKETNDKLAAGEAQIAEGIKKLEAGEQQYNAAAADFAKTKEQASSGLAAAEQQLTAGEQQQAQQEAQLNGLKAALAANTGMSAAERLALEAQVRQGEPQLAAAKAQLAASRAELEAKKKSLADAEAKLAQTKATLAATRQQLNAESQRLEEGRLTASREFRAARKKLETSRRELEKGQKDYEAGKLEADEKLADARAKIADAEKKISDLSKPAWYVLDRDKTPGYVDYDYSADRVAAIAKVFPVFFFLIAALVCLTTMTRMVDEQRTYIGTLKALGYSKLSVASKYLLYAAFASISGSVFGFMIGFKLFPATILNAYSIMFTMPKAITAFNTYYAVLSTAIVVSITILAAWFASSSELHAEPAVLMRPKAPKAGKRIFLERVKPVWSRLNFTQKITARNLFRYKKRFLMTVLGIGGCTALLLSGFGLKDSILSIAATQFDELYKYDMLVQLKKDIAVSERTDLLDKLDAEKRISAYMRTREQSVDIGAGDIEKTVSMVVPEDVKKLEDFVTFRVRGTQEKVPFPEDGVMMTEKLSRMLHVGVGDTIYVKNDDGEKVNVKIIGITEHYISHYIYMPPNVYNKVFDKDLRFQQIMAKTTDKSELFENKLSTDLLENKDIGSIRFTTGISSDFKRIIKSLNYVVLVLIFSAGALAFVVLYNLTNVNVTERLREIATIKVLGFFDREVSAYVDRESTILTIIGMLVGLVMGVFLHRYIIVTAEVEYVMFGRNVKFMSFIYAAVLTLVFSTMVNIVIHFRLKKINMVESLKSVD